MSKKIKGPTQDSRNLLSLPMHVSAEALTTWCMIFSGTNTPPC